MRHACEPLYGGYVFQRGKGILIETTAAARGHPRDEVAELLPLRDTVRTFMCVRQFWELKTAQAVTRSRIWLRLAIPSRGAAKNRHLSLNTRKEVWSPVSRYELELWQSWRAAWPNSSTHRFRGREVLRRLSPARSLRHRKLPEAALP